MFDYIFVLRPLILIPAWSFYLIGAAQGRSVWGMTANRFPAPMAFVSLTAILITAYLLNQVFDREADEKNDKCFFLARGIFQARTVVIMAVIFFLIASTAFQRVSAHHRVPLFIALVLSLLYSLPPLRLCARPFADLAANAIGYGGVAYLLGHLVFSPSPMDGVIRSLPFVFLVGATFLHTAILDEKGDRAAEKKTTVVFLGDRSARKWAVALHGAAVVTSILAGNILAGLITAVTLPLTLIALTRKTQAASSLQVQGSTLVVTVAAIVLWPVYGLLVGPLVLLSRFYYKKRFGITYPGPQRSV